MIQNLISRKYEPASALFCQVVGLLPNQRTVITGDPTISVDHVSYRDTSFIRNRRPIGPYSRTMPRALRGPWGGGLFHMSVDFSARTVITGDPTCSVDQVSFRTITPQTQNPKPKTQNPKPKTANRKPQPLTPKSHIRSAKKLPARRSPNPSPRKRSSAEVGGVLVLCPPRERTGGARG